MRRNRPNDSLPRRPNLLDPDAYENPPRPDRHDRAGSVLMLGLAVVAAAILTSHASRVLADDPSRRPAPGLEIRLLRGANELRGVAPIEIGGYEISYNEPLDPSTVTCADGAWILGHVTGRASGTAVFSNDDRIVRFYVDRRFAAGERLTLVVSDKIRTRSGDPVTDGFWIDLVNGTLPSSASFTKIQTESTDIGAESSRPSGGSACDLDEDGHADIAIVNEDTDDVRLLRNPGQCSAMLGMVESTTYPTGSAGGPNETADFDRDGHIDLCVANVASGSVSVLMGNGDGTFAPHQEIASGSDPHGIAVLDADRDGDLDIAVSNHGSNDVGLLLNDGSGTFGPASFFDAGIDGEWTLAATDMDFDGACDLVVGSRTTSQIAILINQGDGTFSVGSVHPSGGETTMLVVGDLDNDGSIDVATANGTSDTGSILLGTGNGQGELELPVTYATAPNAVATALGDLDGDGDLDWVTSSALGDYHVFENQGDGSFVLATTLAPASNGATALLVDLDGDRDLDIVTVDGVADVVEVHRNDGNDNDCNGNGITDACDFDSGAVADCNGNFIPDVCDIASGDSLDGNGDGVPDECQTVVADCGRGAVDASCGGPAEVLFVNGLHGHDTREVVTPDTAELSIAVTEPPSRLCDGSTTACCIYVWVGTPGGGDVVALPKNLGTMCYGPFVTTTKLPKKTWNSLGYIAKLGPDDGPGGPPVIPDGGSFEIVYLPNGLGRPVVVTFQGVIEDACTQATVPLSITNAITLRLD